MVLDYSMTVRTIIQQRLAQQRLTQDPMQTPDQIVRWMGAVQAQDYAGVKWSIGMRIQPTADDLIEQAFNAGTILRTHVMRPTWHFVASDDIRWLLELTAPRVNAVNAYMYRQLELDAQLFQRSNRVLAETLQGGQTRTRAELGAVLANAGIAAEGTRLSYIMMRAELDAVVCSGPRRGKQFTYALLAERAPRANVLSRDEALAQLTRRYFTGHGPATIQDFVWWSGLSMVDAKAGLDSIASEMCPEQIDGQVYYFSQLPPIVRDTFMTALLLPTYDELLVGYAGYDVERKGGRDSNNDLVFGSTILIGPKIIGSWRRTLKQDVVHIELAPFAPLAAEENAAIIAAAQRYGAFVKKPAHCTIL
jgi:hypothetical protein